MSSLREALPKVRGLSFGFGSEGTFSSLVFGGGKTNSGMRVNSTTAMRLSAVYNAVHIVSGITAHLTIKKYRKTDNGREEITDGSTNLLQFRANKIMSAHHWRKLQRQCQMLHGYSISTIKRDGRGRPRQIRWWHPSRIEIMLTDDYELRYRIRDEDNNYQIYEYSDVIHLNTTVLQENGLLGKSFIEAGAENIGLGMAAEQNAASFFGNGSFPTGVLMREGHFKDKDKRTKFLNSWNKIYSGVENAGKVALLEDGVEYKPLSITPKDAQLLEARGATIEDIARWADIPVHLLKSTQDASYNNLAQFDLSFVKYSIAPQYLTPDEQEYWAKLLSQRERDSGEYYFEHNVDGLLRGDPKTVAEIARIMVSLGIWSVNEVREKFYNMNKMDGKDEPYEPQNIVGDQSNNSDEQDRTVDRVVEYIKANPGILKGAHNGDSI